jgi:putative ABC transport system permease protein
MGSIAMLWTQSFRRGLRLLRRDGIFTVLAVGLLGVGLAATMALLAAFDAVLLRPLPYPRPENIVYLFSTRTTQNQGVLNSLVAIRDLRAWQTRARSLALAGFFYADMNVGGSSREPEMTQGARVTAEFFDLMGIGPARGRLFRADEGTFGSHRVAIISYEYWQRRFDAAPDIIDRTVLIDGEPHTIVGVMPAGMAFLDNVPVVHIFTPIAVRPGDALDSRAQRLLLIVARLRDGFTIEQARREMTAIARQLETEDPANVGIGVRVISPREETVEYNQRALVMLLGGVALLLLTTGLNAAGLLLTRTVARRAEFGLRASLGASRAQVVMQVLAESLPITLLSALIALPIAFAMVGAVGSLMPWTLPRYNPIVLNARVLSIALPIWIALTVGVALPPVLHACRIDLVEALGGHTRAGGLRLPSVAVRKVLMVCQIAFAVALLLGAGLLARTAAALHHFTLGFATEHVVTFRAPFPQGKYALPTGHDVPAALAAANEMLTGVRALPGVQRAGLGSMLPMGHGIWWVRRLTTDASQALPVAQLPTGKVALAGPGFFDALGVTLREGRFFSDRDTATSEPVAIVNESFARSLLMRSQALGQRVRIVRPADTAGAGAGGSGSSSDSGSRSHADERIIVGTIGNIRDSHVERDPEPEIYLPLAQASGESWSNTLAMAIETRGGSGGSGGSGGIDATGVIAAARQKLLAIDPTQPMSQIFTTSELLERRLVRPRFNMQMMIAVALLAVACVSLGIFGLFAYIARLRTTEFAVRLAVGARPAQVARAVLMEALWLSAFGLVAGVVAMILLVPLFQSELYGVARLDPAMIAGATAVMAAVTLASLLVPARYAARLDATACLR